MIMGLTGAINLVARAMILVMFNWFHTFSYNWPGNASIAVQQGASCM